MRARELVLTVTYLALVEIREAAAPESVLDEAAREKLFYLSDLVHSVPVSVLADEKRGGDGSAVLASIRERSRERGIERWLENAISQVSDPP
jgi:hypothetical protein